MLLMEKPFKIDAELENDKRRDRSNIRTEHDTQQADDRRGEVASRSAITEGPDGQLVD